MLYIQWYSCLVMLFMPSIIHTQSSVVTSEGNSKLAIDTEVTRSKHFEATLQTTSNDLSEQIYSAEEVEETNENSVAEQEKVSTLVPDVNYVPLIKSSSHIQLAPNTALPRDETDSDLKQESSSRSQEFELNESSSLSHELEFNESTITDLNRLESDFISHSPCTIELKTTHQFDTNEISEIYQSSGSEDTLSDTDKQPKQRIHNEHFQYLSSEETRITQNNEPANKPFGHDRTEASITEAVEKTLLNQADESFPRKSANDIGLKSLEQSENDGNINEANQIEGQLKVGSTDMNPKVSPNVENGFEFNEETGLDHHPGESFPRKLDRTVELKSFEPAETETSTHEGNFLETTEENLTREMAGNTELNLIKREEVEDGFKDSEDSRSNPTVGSFMRKSIVSNKSKPTQQLEVGDGLKSIDQNGFSVDSDEEVNGESVNGEETNNFHSLNSSFTKIKKANMTDSETKTVDHISDPNHSHNESRLVLDSFQHASNNSAHKLSNNIGSFQESALPKEQVNDKEENFPTSNAKKNDLEVNAEQSENLQIRNVDSKYIARNTSFTSEIEKDYVIDGSSKQLDSMHVTNYKSESDSVRQSNAESSVLKAVYDEHNRNEENVNKRNSGEFDICEEPGCLETATSTDYESADFSSEPIPKIQKERIRAVGRVLANAVNSKLFLNDSVHKVNQSAYEYLESIEFNLHEVIFLIKTDSNLRAFIFNIIILYVPVLICDVFLVIVIVKLVRHIRRYLNSNKQPTPGQSLLIQENESEETDKLIDPNINPNTKAKRAGNCIENDLYASSSEFSEQNVWYPPS